MKGGVVFIVIKKIKHQQCSEFCCCVILLLLRSEAEAISYFQNSLYKISPIPPTRRSNVNVPWLMDMELLHRKELGLSLPVFSCLVSDLTLTDATFI